MLVELRRDASGLRHYLRAESETSPAGRVADDTEESPASPRVQEETMEPMTPTEWATLGTLAVAALSFLVSTMTTLRSDARAARAEQRELGRTTADEARERREVERHERTLAELDDARLDRETTRAREAYLAIARTYLRERNETMVSDVGMPVVTPAEHRAATQLEAEGIARFENGEDGEPSKIYVSVDLRPEWAQGTM